MKELRPILMVVFATLAISLACGQEVPEDIPTMPTATEAPAPPAISNTPTTTMPTAAPAPATEQQPLPAITTEVPSPTSPPRAAARTAGTSDALVVLGSHSATAPSGFGPSGAGGLNLSPLPHTVPVAGSLTVSVTGSVTVVPDEAYVVVIPERDYGISGPEQLSSEDRRDIVANLADVGVSEEAVDFEHFGRYEPSMIAVEVNVEEYADAGEGIVAAIEKVVRRSESTGVRFSLSDENCEWSVSLARREAVPMAEGAAADLAEALGLERGEVIGALEYPLQDLAYGLPGAGLSGCTSLNANRFSPLLPFDSDAEVEISVGLQVSYAIR